MSIFNRLRDVERSPVWTIFAVAPFYIVRRYFSDPQQGILLGGLYILALICFVLIRRKNSSDRVQSILKDRD